MGKKLTSLKRYISATTDNDEKWFVIFEHTINLHSFGNVRLPQPEYYLSCFVSFFLLFFSFSAHVSTFKPLNALYSKFE